MKRKKTNNITLFTLATVLMALSGAVLTAADLQVGTVFPALQGEDQHEQEMTIGTGTAHVVVTFTMGMGKKANKYFAEHGEGFLETHSAVLINDIFGMPAVGRVFALPKMRKYPHRIFLADADGLLDPFPQEEDRATVFDLDAEMRIVAIRFWDPEDGTSPF
jgi:hypothetical protein